jgi:putative flippase GtrA
MVGFTALGMYYLLAQVIATGVALVWNFLTGRFVVFRRLDG